MLRYLPFLLVLALWIYAFIDCLNTPEDQVRKLPKGAWVLIIVLFGYVLFGSLAWLLAGRPRRTEGAAPGSYGGGRRTRWVAPDDNPDFLRSLNRDRDPGPAGKPDAGTGGGAGGTGGAAEGEKDRERPRGRDDDRGQGGGAAPEGGRP
ncbi:PLDc N-terminal domain-containing protein [Streptomyces sp. URMC 123]|uniref:PLDc N-terminal domain-containing protein n=1 Tax=Streptomyces sp. URMC 123 TaxID=3423403 RepID=UPI003F1D3427